MRQGQEKRARGFLSRGALLSLLLHFNLLGPLGLAAWHYAGEEEARRAEEVDVAFEQVNPEDLPKDLPSIESPPDELDKVARQQPLDPKKKKEPVVAEQKKPEQKKAETPPEPEVLVPPQPPPPEQPPPPPEPRNGHEKMVDVDTESKTPPPPDAKYLAEKNNRAEVETRARDTNLEKARKGEPTPTASSEKDSPDSEKAGGEKEKIAELEEQKSALGKRAPEATPHLNPEVARPKDEPDRPRPSLLALRDPAPRAHELTPETADPSLPKTADGDLQRHQAARGEKSDPSRVPPGNRVKLELTGTDYEYMFGADAEAERRLAQKQRSMKVGKHLTKVARAGSALENFLPEVQEGMKTALNTRAAPFAAYIARMHRSIHKLWGFGALEEWDEQSSSSPLNNPNLVTTVEIVLNRDGTVDKVGVVRASGYGPYDAAARDVVFTAGPYPEPPRAIRSANGKIYLHWRFYRDERQCATSGVDPWILDNGPKGGDRPDGPAIAQAGGGDPHVHAAGDGHAHGAEAATPHPMGAAPAGPAPTVPASSTSGAGGLRQLRRFDKTAHRAGLARLDEEVATAEESEAAEGGGAAATSSPASRAADPAAREMAVRWFGALAAKDAKTLAALATLPFKTSGKDVVKRATLASMLGDLIDEGGGGTGRAADVQVHTAASLRATIGKLPPNIEDAAGVQLYAVVGAGSRDVLILILGQRSGGWKPVGLVRR